MNERRILYSECLEIYKIERSFVEELNQSGLVRLVTEQDREFVECDELEYLEQFIRWNRDLDINVAGIEALHHLLQRMNSLQDKLTRLKNELAFYKK
jgi:hypothetical protein